jgi:uncharacterized protein (DUF169 family)
MQTLHSFNEAIKKYVGIETHPIAIKMLEDESEIPDGLGRPQEMWGHRIAVCQGWGRARWNGESIAMLKDDISCPIALFTFGMADPPANWSEGGLYLNWYTPSEQAAMNFANSMCKLPKGKYKGIAMAPIDNCGFQPDLVLIYCYPSQLLRLIIAAIMNEGGRFENSIFPPGVCTDTISPTVLTGKCHFGIPCYGDLKYEYSSQFELVFSSPAARLEEIAHNVKFFYEKGHPLPQPRPLDHASFQLQTYIDLRNML